MPGRWGFGRAADASGFSMACRVRCPAPAAVATCTPCRDTRPPGGEIPQPAHGVIAIRLRDPDDVDTSFFHPHRALGGLRELFCVTESRRKSHERYNIR